MHEFELPWPPSVNHYYRRVGNRILISRKGREYRIKVIAILRSLGVRPLEGNLEIIIDAYPPDARRRDGDNLLKSLLDSIERGGGYGDDSQLKDIEIHMREPFRPNGCVKVRISQK